MTRFFPQFTLSKHKKQTLRFDQDDPPQAGRDQDDRRRTGLPAAACLRQAGQAENDSLPGFLGSRVKLFLSLRDTERRLLGCCILLS
jgi:hypothetical protein